MHVSTTVVAAAKAKKQRESGSETKAGSESAARLSNSVLLIPVPRKRKAAVSQNMTQKTICTERPLSGTVGLFFEGSSELR